MNNDRLLGALEAKLEELHADIRDLKTEVSALKADFIKRQMVYKLALWFVSVLAGLVGWILQHILNR